MDLQPGLIADAARNGVQRPVVDVAYEALSRFGDDLTRGQAMALLETWHWRPPLGQREHEALLARFGS